MPPTVVPPAPFTRQHSYGASFLALVAGASFLALVAGAVAIGFAPIFVRLSEVGPTATAFWRLALSLPALWIWLAVSSRRNAGQAHAPASRADALALGATGLLFAIEIVFWHWTVRLTSVANAKLLGNLSPVYVVGFGWLFWRRRVGGRFLLALAVAMAGAVLLLGADLPHHAHALAGEFAGLVASGFYAGYLMLVGALRQRFPAVSIMA